VRRICEVEQGLDKAATGVRETTMFWIGRFWSSMANGAPSPFNADEAIRSGPETSASPLDTPNSPIPEEIKRRQILLTLRYVEAVRAH
jgi:hypothetical protein